MRALYDANESAHKSAMAMLRVYDGAIDTRHYARDDAAMVDTAYGEKARHMSRAALAVCYIVIMSAMMLHGLMRAARRRVLMRRRRRRVTPR